MSSELLNNFLHPQIKMQSQQESEMFTPNYKKGKANVYNAIVRFIPNPTDPINKSVIKKNVAYLKNPLTNEGHYVDCPSTVGKPDPIVNTFFKLRNSSSPQDNENSKQFSRSQRFYSIVQVIQCVDEKLVGKFLIWNYGVSVYNKIFEEMNPNVTNNFGIGANSTNPFDVLIGRPFYIVCKEKGGYSNFEDSRFMDVHYDNNPKDVEMFSIKIPTTDANGNAITVPITAQTATNPKVQELIVDFFNNKIPDLNRFEYKEWDADTQNFVAGVINYYCGNNTQNSVYNAAPQQTPQVQQAGSPSFAASGALNLNDVLNQAQQNNGVVQQPQAEPQQAAQPAQSSGGINDINGLGEVLGFNQSAQTAQSSSPSSGAAIDGGLNLDDIISNNF